MSATFDAGRMSTSRIIAAYLGDIAFELRKMLRNPMFAIPTLVFPAMFYLLFAVLMGAARGNAQLETTMFANYGVFGTMAPGLFGFGVSLAFERELGTLTWRQALPAPPASYLLARMVMAMIFVAVIVAILGMLALFVSRIPLTAGQLALVFAVNVLGVLPFCAIGLFVGALISGQAAPAVINLIYLPMAYASGLWVPFQYLPPSVQQIAPLWPAYHLDQLALGAVGLPTLGTVANHVGALAGVTILFFALAVRRLGARGVRLFGARRTGAAGRPRGLGHPLRRAAGIVTAAAAIGLIVTGYLGGTAKVAAAAAGAPVSRTAATPDPAKRSDAATAPGSTRPPGVAAPRAPLISDFESGSADAAYGLGWAATDDRTRGGNSSAALRVVDGGAGGSRHALEIRGSVGDGIQYPFVGASLLPAGRAGVDFPDQPLADYTGRSTLRFNARGDGRQYLVLIMGAQLDAMPAMYGFDTSPEWTQVIVPLETMANLDLARVRVIAIGAMEPRGDFELQIDDVEIR